VTSPFLPAAQIGTNRHFRNAKQIRKIQHHDAALSVDQVNDFVPSLK
jgi:hypothetical protein